MDSMLVKKLLDSFHEVKKLLELAPSLPKGMSPRHVVIIDRLHQLLEEYPKVKISDISNSLGVTRPSITKLVRELEELKVVRKIADTDDKRVTHLELTDLGRQYYDFYVRKYHCWLGKQLENFDEDSLRLTVDTLHKLYLQLGKSKVNFK